MIFPQYRGAFNVVFCGCLALLVSSTSAELAGSLPSWMRFGSAHDGGIQQWTNCTPSDYKPREVSIGMAMTSHLLNRFGNNQAEARRWMQSVVDGTNFIYMNQLNVRLVGRDTFFAPATGIEWNSPSCELTMHDQLAKFSAWKPPSEQGIWHLLDDCLHGDQGPERGMDKQSGMAYQGSLCHMSPNAHGTYGNVGISQYLYVPLLGDLTYRVFAHEVGHNFGAPHPYGEQIVVKDGGIMSYGSGHYHCDLGFNPLDKDEICSVLTYLEKTQCAALSVPKTPEGDEMTRVQFMAEVPAEPPNVDSAIYTCGSNGFSFAELVVMAALALGLCCCCCCMITLGCCRAQRKLRSKLKGDEDEDEGEDEEVGAE